MKNYLLLFFLSISLSLGAQQMGFNVIEFAVEPNSEDQIAELFDEFYTNKKFKSGGVVLESLEHGRRGERTHRIVWMWELGNGGLVEGEVAEHEGKAFWSSLGNFINTDVPSERYAGRILSWKEGDTSITPQVHIWDFKPSDPVAFQKAHDRIVKDAAKAFENRTVGFGTYDVNQQNGASHWVVITGKNLNDNLALFTEMETTYRKEMERYLQDRGEVNNIRDYVINILKRYN